MARTSVKGVPRRLAAATAAILYVALAVARPAQALDQVIDQAAIGKLVDQINALKQQLAELQKANGLLNDQLNALGRAGQISVPMVNMDRLASRLRQDAQCLAPDLQKLMPDVEYDDATFGSICAAGDAYRKSLWLDPDKIAKKPWEDQVAATNAIEKRRQNMAVDVASKAIGQGDIDVKEADRLGQSADELDAAAKAAVSDNERLAVIAQGSVLHARSAALQTQILAQLLKVQSSWFALTALPPGSTLAKEDDK